MISSATLTREVNIVLPDSPYGVVSFTLDNTFEVGTETFEKGTIYLGYHLVDDEPVYTLDINGQGVCPLPTVDASGENVAKYITRLPNGQTYATDHVYDVTPIELATMLASATTQYSADAIVTYMSSLNADDLGSGDATDGYVLTADGAGASAWEAASGGLTTSDIDTLAELNTIVTDATLIDTGDSRLSDARTPTAHASSHATGGADALTAYSIGAVRKAGDTMTGQLNSSGTDHYGFKLLTLTTAQRDALTPSGGEMIRNSTTGNIEAYSGTAWVTVGASTGIGGSTGATDNAILRADGTGGATAQGSLATIDDSGDLFLKYLIVVGSSGGKTQIKPAHNLNYELTDKYTQASLKSDFASASTEIMAKGQSAIKVDTSATAGNTRLLVYDVDNAALERVSVGAPDSGGAGFKVLRIPN